MISSMRPMKYAVGFVSEAAAPASAPSQVGRKPAPAAGLTLVKRQLGFLQMQLVNGGF
jgi:hypothetical protein